MYRIAAATLMLFTLFEPRAQAGSRLWLCGLTEDAVRLACVADVDPSNVGDPAQTPSVFIHGTAFPLDPRRVYFIDLWSPPTEIEFVERLARSTICYRSPGCTVIVSGEHGATTAQNRLPTLNGVSEPKIAKMSAAMP